MWFRTKVFQKKESKVHVDQQKRDISQTRILNPKQETFPMSASNAAELFGPVRLLFFTFLNGNIYADILPLFHYYMWCVHLWGWEGENIILVQSFWDQDKPYPKMREKAGTHPLFQKFSQKECLHGDLGCFVMSENFVCIKTGICWPEVWTLAEIGWISSVVWLFPIPIPKELDRIHTDWGVWWATVHGVTKGQTWLRN